MNTFKIQTVKCVDRDAYVREVTDSNGDLVCELALSTTEKPQASKYEALIAAAPDLHLAVLQLIGEFAVATKGGRSPNQELIFQHALKALAKAKGETV